MVQKKHEQSLLNLLLRRPRVVLKGVWDYMTKTFGESKGLVGALCLGVVIGLALVSIVVGGSMGFAIGTRVGPSIAPIAGEFTFLGVLADLGFGAAGAVLAIGLSLLATPFVAACLMPVVLCCLACTGITDEGKTEKGMLKIIAENIRDYLQKIEEEEEGQKVKENDNESVDGEIKIEEVPAESTEKTLLIKKLVVGSGDSQDESNVNSNYYGPSNGNQPKIFDKRDGSQQNKQDEQDEQVKRGFCAVQ